MAKGNAIPLNVQELIKAGGVASQHACALLGVVTHAANHKEVTAVRKDGTTFIKKIRDTSTATGAKKVAPSKAEVVLACEQVELDVPSDDWAANWEASEEAKRATTKRPAAALQKAEARRKQAKLSQQQSQLNTKRVIQLAASTAKPCATTQSAESRLNLLKTRVLERAAKDSEPPEVSVFCTESARV